MHEIHDAMTGKIEGTIPDRHVHLAPRVGGVRIPHFQGCSWYLHHPYIGTLSDFDRDQLLSRFAQANGNMPGIVRKAGRIVLADLGDPYQIGESNSRRRIASPLYGGTWFVYRSSAMDYSEGRSD